MRMAFLSFLICYSSSNPVGVLRAQDLTHYKEIVKELSSAKYQGRGYAKGGANKAGKFLKKEYAKIGVDEITLQPFKLDVQTFAGKMVMETNSNLTNSNPSGTFTSCI